MGALPPGGGGSRAGEARGGGGRSSSRVRSQRLARLRGLEIERREGRDAGRAGTARARCSALGSALQARAQLQVGSDRGQQSEPRLGPRQSFLGLFYANLEVGGEEGRSQRRVIRGGLVTALGVWFSVENAPHALPGRKFWRRPTDPGSPPPRTLPSARARTAVNNKQQLEEPGSGAPTVSVQGAGCGRWRDANGGLVAKSRGNAHCPPRGPGGGLSDPSLKFLLGPGLRGGTAFPAAASQLPALSLCPQSTPGSGPPEAARRGCFPLGSPVAGPGLAHPC